MKSGEALFFPGVSLGAEEPETPQVVGAIQDYYARNSDRECSPFYFWGYADHRFAARIARWFPFVPIHYHPDQTRLPSENGLVIYSWDTEANNGGELVRLSRHLDKTYGSWVRGPTPVVQPLFYGEHGWQRKGARALWQSGVALVPQWVRERGVLASIHDPGLSFFDALNQLLERLEKPDVKPETAVLIGAPASLLRLLSLSLQRVLGRQLQFRAPCSKTYSSGFLDRALPLAWNDSADLVLDVSKYPQMTLFGRPMPSFEV